MKTPERFERALSKLVKAFFNDELAKGDCSKCAVGNMCDNCNDWSNVFVTTDEEQLLFPSMSKKELDMFGRNFPYVIPPNSKRVIDSTGYSWQELAKIEKAFENSTSISFGDYKLKSKQEIMEDQFKGLMAVVDVLCEIEGLDSEQYKMKFEYNEDLTPVMK